MRIVLASGNTGKLRELQAILGPEYDLVAQSELGLSSPEETGQSFTENALLKAYYVARKTGMIAIADDSGLEVNALNGAPGVYSARYAGERASDSDNNNKLLHALSNTPNEADRGARFVCCIVMVSPDCETHPIICQGYWSGTILTEPQGENGFGYDPIFKPHNVNLSSAQLTREQKNQISHRANALQLLKVRLSEYGLANSN